MKIVALLASAVAMVGCGQAAPDEPADDELAPAAVTCAPVVVAMVGDATALRGVVAPPPRADAQIGSTMAGRIRAVLVEEGDRVTAGQVIASIDEPAMAAGSDTARAAVAAATAAFANATAQRDRQERLLAQGIAASKDVEEARARAASAQADLDAARAGNRLAAGQLARTDVRAPMAGTVLRVFRRTGEAVDGTPATPIVELADLVVLELRAEVPAARLLEVAPGAAASVRFDALPEVAIPGRVLRIALAVDPATSLGAIRILLTPPPETRLLVGLTGTAAIVRGLRPGLLVPATALRRSSEGSDEIVVCGGDKGATAAVRAVEVGPAHAGVVEVKTGLTATDQVVVDRALGLADGQPLERGP
jgi:RND family efflux transporter MFP subunit